MKHDHEFFRHDYGDLAALRFPAPLTDIVVDVDTELRTIELREQDVRLGFLKEEARIVIEALNWIYEAGITREQLPGVVQEIVERVKL